MEKPDSRHGFVNVREQGIDGFVGDQVVGMAQDA